MLPLDQIGREIIQAISLEKLKDEVIEFYWEVGKILIIDNWRVFHGRGESTNNDTNRILCRITVI